MGAHVSTSSRRAVANVNRERDIINGIRRGLADIQAGRIVTHEQAMAEARQLVEDIKRRKSAVD
jgi:predicted transcriptional regulator